MARQEGRALLLISHDLDFVARHASRALRLSNGEIAASGTPDEVLRHPDLQDQELMAAPTPPALWRVLELPVCTQLDVFEQQWRQASA